MITLPAGATVFTLNGLADTRDMSGWLAGALRTGGNVVPLRYPNASPFGPGNSITTGVRMIRDAMSTPGPKVFAGHSEGAQVIARYVAEHQGDPDAPTPGEVTLVLMGNPLRNPGGRGIGVLEIDRHLGQPTPDSQWPTLDVARRRDPWAIKDSASWWNFWWYSSVVHPHYENVNLNDPANQVTVRGNTTLITTP